MRIDKTGYYRLSIKINFFCFTCALRMRHRRELWAFAVLPIVSAVAWVAFFWTVYGTPNPAAPYGAMTQSSVFNMPRGVLGVLVDQQFGLFANSPVYGLIAFGCACCALTRRRWSVELLAIAVPYVASVAMYQHWWGGGKPWPGWQAQLPLRR